jgi:hypothetical protein
MHSNVSGVADDDSDSVTTVSWQCSRGGHIGGGAGLEGFSSFSVMVDGKLCHHPSPTYSRRRQEAHMDFGNFLDDWQNFLPRTLEFKTDFGDVHASTSITDKRCNLCDPQAPPDYRGQDESRIGFQTLYGSDESPFLFGNVIPPGRSCVQRLDGTKLPVHVTQNSAGQMIH